jgi:tRNA-binding EMAP/Myf-like protein
LLVVNLEPREMIDELSEGMILNICYTDKIMPVLSSYLKETRKT